MALHIGFAAEELGRFAVLVDTLLVRARKRSLPTPGSIVFGAERPAFSA
jgi:hypothetical protein